MEILPLIPITSNLESGSEKPSELPMVTQHGAGRDIPTVKVPVLLTSEPQKLAGRAPPQSSPPATHTLLSIPFPPPPLFPIGDPPFSSQAPVYPGRL